MDERLYAWQAEALDAWELAGRRGIVEAVTGTGKTRVGQSAIEAALKDGRRSVVLVPGKELQRQWRSTLRRDLPGSVRIGLSGDGHHDRLDDHQILISIVDSARTHAGVPRGFRTAGLVGFVERNGVYGNETFELHADVQG